MALRDVKEYYYTMLGQYLESKEDLADFNIALKDGYITEDQLEDVKDDVEKLKMNLDRIQYIMYLFELPNRKKKQINAKHINKTLENYFIQNKIDLDSVKSENTSVLDHLRAELKNKIK